MSYEQQSRYISQRLMNFTGEGLDTLALEVFRFQARHNATYAEYLSLLGIPPSDIRTVADIPFLPVSFFKTHCIKTGKWPARVTFTSSGTTGPATSRHPVRDIAFYKKNTERGFERFYGHPSGFRILALLPSYIERTGSSLLCMANHFIGLSTYPESGFFLHHTDELLKALEKSKKDR
ncbi:MAG TPA: acyl transferase, partial [Bacteroidetes bacterium]|nr:acyl transferase [Bacteroidota bacterium]